MVDLCKPREGARVELSAFLAACRLLPADDLEDLGLEACFRVGLWLQNRVSENCDVIYRINSATCFAEWLIQMENIIWPQLVRHSRESFPDRDCIAPANDGLDRRDTEDGPVLPDMIVSIKEPEIEGHRMKIRAYRINLTPVFPEHTSDPEPSQCERLLVMESISTSEVR